MTMKRLHPQSDSAFDTSSRPEFVSYYAAQSVTPETFARFGVICDKVIRLWEGHNASTAPALDVVDIGCGAGTSSQLWAERGHRVSGLDVNAPLIDIARRRCRETELDIRFDVGTAASLPYPDESFDVCLLPELLEHVAEWEKCLEEAVRVLKPGAVLYLSTTNVLCPKQQEFSLPLYSWYPGPLKRRYERLAVTTRPELASFARYPAVNWFSFYGVRAWFGARGMLCLDRFDQMDADPLGPPARLALGLVRSLAPVRFLAHVMTPYLVIFALKPTGSGSTKT
jgi:2-polyprenyl-6-hydroxyphenyl methylase/3-demethylubiquinone-9 3-methyltransferase